MKDEIQSYRDKYGVESPEELALDSAGADEETWRMISEWESIRQNLSLAETALSYGQTRRLIEA